MIDYKEYILYIELDYQERSKINAERVPIIIDKIKCFQGSQKISCILKEIQLENWIKCNKIRLFKHKLNAFQKIAKR